ncbi:MAG: glycosyltransferase [Mariniblastus sp.]|nr:glycosyltransferase [Mariniblastus sp.]
MNIDIAICTRNRAEAVRQTLESMVAMKSPRSIDVRFLVVDNASDDNTKSVVQSYFDKLNLSLFHESRQGHAFARNHAISQAMGDWLIWTDDDVQVDSNWLTAYSEAFQEFPDSTFFGGPIQPVFTPRQPSWIQENWDKLRGCFAERQLGDTPFRFTTDQLPYGANFAIRTVTQKQHLFNTELGRRGESVVGHDEISLFHKLFEKGHLGHWIPAARISHVIGPERQTASYIRNYFIGQGRMLVANQRQWNANPKQLARESRWELICSRIKRFIANSDTWTSHLIRSGLAEGQYRELVEGSTDVKPPAV